MNRKIISLIVVSIVLASCGPVTPVPLATSTAKMQPVATIPDATVTAQVQSTPSSQIEEYLPPAHSVSDYELLPWTKEYSDGLLHDLEGVAQNFYPYERYRTYYSAFSTEGWLRSNSDDEKKFWLCNVVKHTPASEAFPILRDGQDLFSYYVEELLNNQHVPPNELEDRFREAYGTSACLDKFSLNISGNIYFEPIFASNLFGDVQESFVFVVGAFYDETSGIAVYATHSVDGVLHVEKIRDWKGYSSLLSSTDFKLVDIGDLNNNGRSEIVVQVDYGASGFPTHEAEWIYWYEWDLSTSSFQESNEIEIFNQECYVGACYGSWEFSRLANSSELILTTNEYFNTGLTDCEYLTREKVYAFKGGDFSLKSDNLLLPESASSACQTSWAYQILVEPDGWKNDKAITIVSDAVDNWPEEMNSVWGNGGHSYFQLMLGIWLDLRAEYEQSMLLFESLVSPSDQSASPFITQLADAYLAIRQQRGLVVACSEMNAIQQELLLQKYGEEATRFIKFGSNRWPTFIDDFCNENAALSVAFQNIDSQSMEVDNADNLKEWLTLQGKEDIYVKTIEVGEGKSWVASFKNETIKSYDINVYQVWAFTKTSTGSDAVYLNEMRLDIKKTEVSQYYNEDSINLILFQPDEDVQIVLIEFDDCLAFFDVSSRTILSESLCGFDLFFSVTENRVDVLFEDYYSLNPTSVSYQWDTLTRTFNKFENIYDFQSAVTYAETLIYKEQKYNDAIVNITAVLLSAPIDPKVSTFCENFIAETNYKSNIDFGVPQCGQYPIWFRPYLNYLLGLAYELSEYPDQAKSIYYELWKEYPDNFFGIAASRRLVEKVP